MYEELLIDDKSQPTLHPKIIKGTEKFIEYDMLMKEIEILKHHLLKNNVTEMVELLRKLVDGYKPSQALLKNTHKISKT